MECAQHGDSFGGKLNGLQSRAGQQRSHPYGKEVLTARASSPPAVQGSRVVLIFNNEWHRTGRFGQFLTNIRSFVLTLFIFKAPNYVLARTLTERVV